MLLFAANTNLGYRIFSYENEKFTNVFVKAFTKTDATGLRFGKSNYSVENCHRTVSLIFCFLR